MVQQSQPRLKPIRSDNLLERFQIDLVDMRHNKVEIYSRKYVDKNLNKQQLEDKKN